MEPDRLRVRKKTLQSVLEQCQRALQQMEEEQEDDDPGPEPACGGDGKKEAEEEKEEETGGGCPLTDSDADVYYDTEEICDLVKSKVESPEFLEKLGSIHMSSSHFPDESASWDLVSTKDLWDKPISGENGSDQDDYVLVKQEDIVEGIACFMAAYLLSLEQAKALTPNQLQEVLSQTFSVKKKKSKLQKAWHKSKLVYNVASWGATAIGIYQNPAILRAASAAFWTSCRALSKFL